MRTKKKVHPTTALYNLPRGALSLFSFRKYKKRYIKAANKQRSRINLRPLKVPSNAK
jgi:hypothetical protein